MRIADIVDEKLAGKLAENKVIGIDIGSRTGKAVLLGEGNIYTAQIGTGFDMQETANELLKQLFEQSGYTMEDIEYIVGTGYGRVSMEFPQVPKKIVSEISAHAMGVHYLDANVRTIIDIGGQDSKAIKVDPMTGKVVDFIMNDKCAAGTGRFLEKVATILGFTVETIGEEALKSDKDVEISSQCVVFAESEIVSLRASGETAQDIAAGVHYAAAKRVYTLVKRVELEPELQFSGGVANNVGMCHALEKVIGHPIKETKLNMIYAGCLGAAVYALKYLTMEETAVDVLEPGGNFDTEFIKEEVKEGQEAFVADNGKKKVGYVCSYTPPELLNAAGVNHARLFKAGDTETVAAGEVMTKSVFCDLTKSCLGSFAMKNPIYDVLDKVYTFYTCASMRKVAESINENFVPTEIYTLPRQTDRENSRQEFRKEMENFRLSLEALSGNTISKEAIKEQIKQYNKVRQGIRKISELRKLPDPPIKGNEFLEITKAYFYLGPDKMLTLLDEVYDRLSKVQTEGKRRIRLMMLGGVVADGDKRLLEIVENQIGARIVVEDHCTGLSPFYYDMDEEKDPVEALADGYLDQAPCARMSPIEKRVEFAAKLAEEYQVDGIIYGYMKFCPCYGITKNCFIQKFHDMGLPVLEMAIDYSKSDDGQIKTRVEAFIEVLLEVMADKEAENGR